MKAAFLSGSLISSKGSAAPATRSQPPQDLLARRVPVSKSVAAQESNRSSAPSQTDQIRKPSSITNPVRTKASQVLHDEPNQTAVSDAARTPIRRKPVASTADSYRREQKKLRKDTMGRVRMSIRLDPEDHLALKLLAAHSRKSSQNILEEALREYADRHAEEILPQSCNCLQKPILS